MPRLYVQAQKFQIAGSGVSSSATSITLVSFKIIKPNGSTRDITMADFGDLGLMVLEPGVSRKEETISFTGVTQNGDGSATLTGVTRGITPFSPYGADSSYASSHSGFVTAILSNPAKMYSNFIGPSDNVTVTGLWDFPYPTSSTSPATKQYVDDVLVGAIGTANDTTAGSTKMTKNQGSKPRSKSTYVREQDTPDMTLKVESFKLAFIDSSVVFTGGNSPAFINPGLGGDLAIVSNPSNTETVTLTINGTVCTFTFVTVIGATPGNILIQGTAAATRAALAAFIASPGTTNANQVAFTGAQLTAMGLVSSTDDLSANLFIRANSSTVTTFTGAETMAGGSNTWTANTTKNRIDLLVVNGGSLAIRKGSEAVSPTAPTPTTGDTVLCSVYNVPGETVIRDRTAASSGYIDEWYDLGVYRTDLVTSSTLSNSIKFGGNGSDGALNISSGTTNIDVGGARIYVLNYTSLSITGTGALTFSNPHANGTFIIIKVKGDVTLTSSATPMIDASGMGAKGGASQVVGASANVAGLAGNIGQGFLFKVGGGGGAGAAPGPVGAAGATVSSVTTYEQIDSFIASKYSRLVPGSGGGTGASNTSAGGSAVLAAGGNGGGVLVIECAGTWTFTTTNGISVAGKTPATSTSSGGNSTSGGSAGGSGGYFLGLYNTLGTNTGTVNISAGTGGIGTNTSGSTHYGGGSGGNLLGAGVAGTSSATSGVKTGADGVVGYSAIIKNTEFA